VSVDLAYYWRWKNQLTLLAVALGMPTAVLVNVKRVTAMVEDLSVQMVGAASRTANLSAEALLVLALVARPVAGECHSKNVKKYADLVSMQGVVAATLTALLETARMVIVPDLEHRRRYR